MGNIDGFALNMRLVLICLVIACAMGNSVRVQSHLSSEQVIEDTCLDGYVLVNGQCQEYCQATNSTTGMCDPNCLSYSNANCTLCADNFVMKEGVCVQLSWGSDETTVVGEGTLPNDHVTVVVPSNPSWQKVPDADWVWDKNTNQVGTFLFTDSFAFDPYLWGRITKVVLDVSVDDYYRILVNGKVVIEKGGVYNQPPVSYDITNFVRITATSKSPNELEIHATNSGGPGGLSYKVTAVTGCAPNSALVNGECVCNGGSINYNGGCHQSVWVSGTNTKAGDGAGYPAVVVQQQGGWQPITGTQWIWDTNQSRVGTFRFVDNIVLTPYLSKRVGSVSITLACDDYYKLVFNGQTITEKGGVWNGPPVSYDLTNYFRANATAANPNVLLILATNIVGPGGLQYKLEVKQSCGDLFDNVNGVCTCKAGYSAYGNNCAKLVYTSSTATRAGEAAERAAVAVQQQGGWQPIPGTQWIWDVKTENVGTFRFTEKIVGGVNAASVSVTLACDDYYKLSFNGITITEKGGVWNGPPVSYDLTPYYRANATFATPNLLEIRATNIVGPGGLQYKLVIKPACNQGAKEVNGLCVCQAGTTKVADRCIQTAWKSGVPQTKSDNSLPRSAIATPLPQHQRVPGSAWIWHPIANKVGTFTFRKAFWVTDWARQRMDKAFIQVSVDDYCRITLNGKLIADKAGSWNGAPVSYDVTSALNFNGKNYLVIDATNIGGNGLLSYRFYITMQCGLNAEDVGGTCRCKAGYGKINGVCSQTHWYSGPNTLVSEGEGTHSCAEVSADGGWKLVPGATWVWDTDRSRQGTYRFYNNVQFSDWLRSRVNSVSLDVSVDDYYKVVINGKTVTERAGVWNQAPIHYDVTSFIANSGINLMEIFGTNTGGPGGLSYKLVAHQKCANGLVETDGVCDCADGSTMINDQCIQTSWFSTTSTRVGDGAGVYSVQVTPHPEWKPVPGATWIWDTQIMKTGTFRFVENIQVGSFLAGRVDGASVTLSCDDFYKIIFNDQVITDRAGVWNGQPLTFDLSSYFRPTGNNVLQIIATNTGWHGGLAYRVDVRQKCGGAPTVNGQCVQTAWYSTTNTKVGDGAGVNSVQVTPHPEWKPVPGATWIWDTQIMKTGTFRFVENVTVPPTLQNKVDSAWITLSCDDFYKIVINDQVVTDRAGVWNGQPLTFELTKFFKSSGNNVVQIFASNTGWHGGLAYKIYIRQRCQDGAEDINGVCTCSAGFQKVGGQCLQVAWISGCPETLVATSTHAAVVVPQSSGWQPVTGAQWVWETNTSKTGKFNFVDTFKVTDAAIANMDKATLDVSVDDFYRIVFNGNVVTERAGVWNGAPITYDVTNFLRDSRGRLLNTHVLQIDATNSGGPGGLSYHFGLRQRCPTGSEDVNGVCQCASTSWSYNGNCAQSVWFSDTSVLVGDGANKVAAVQITPHPEWKPVPGATWIWIEQIMKTGTYSFWDSISLPLWMKNRMDKATITLSVDDYYKLVFNGQTITERSGVWNQPPITFDVTNFVVFADTPSRVNTIQVVASNTGWHGGIAFRFDLKQKCPDGETDVGGRCDCVAGAKRMNGVCVRLEFVSGSNTVAGEGSNAHSAVVVAEDWGWKPIPGAQWIWDGQKSNVGTYSFTENFTVPDDVINRVQSATLLVSVDDYYKIVFNGRTITEKAGVWNQNALSYELSSFLIFSDDDYPQNNKLQIFATNSGGPGGLQYKLTITLSS